VDQAKTVKARISKSSLSAAWKTLSGTVKLFHKFEGVTPKRALNERGWAKFAIFLIAFYFITFLLT